MGNICLISTAIKWRKKKNKTEKLTTNNHAYQKENRYFKYFLWARYIHKYYTSKSSQVMFPDESAFKR